VRRHGCPRNISKRTVKRKSMKVGRLGVKIKRLGNNRRGWEYFTPSQCSTLKRDRN
jgi:hypothetical protein